MRRVGRRSSTCRRAWLTPDKLYVVAGSASGTNPGTTIGAFTVPLNLDSYTDFTLAFANTGPYVNTFSTLNADGRALAQLVVPPATGLTGVIVHHAYGVIDAFGISCSRASPLRSRSFRKV